MPRGSSVFVSVAWAALVASVTPAALAQFAPLPDNGGVSLPSLSEGFAGAGSSYFYSGQAGMVAVSPLPAGTELPGTAGNSASFVPYGGYGGTTATSFNGVVGGGAGGATQPTSGFTSNPSACAVPTSRPAGHETRGLLGGLTLLLLAWRRRRS